MKRTCTETGAQSLFKHTGGTDSAHGNAAFPAFHLKKRSPALCRFGSLALPGTYIDLHSSQCLPYSSILCWAGSAATPGKQNPDHRKSLVHALLSYECLLVN